MGSSVGTIGAPANAQQAAIQQELLTNHQAYSPQNGGMVQTPGTSNLQWIPPASQTGAGGQGFVAGPQPIDYGMQSPGGLVNDPNSNHLVVTPPGEGNQSPANLAAVNGPPTPNTTSQLPPANESMMGNANPGG